MLPGIYIAAGIRHFYCFIASSLDAIYTRMCKRHSTSINAVDVESYLRSRAEVDAVEQILSVCLVLEVI